MMAVGSYTAAAHSPMIATVSSPVLTSVRRVYGPLKISLKGWRRRINSTFAVRCPFLGLPDSHDDQQRDHNRRETAEEHCAPTEAGSHRVVKGGGEEESGVVAGLQIASSHFSAVFGPCLRDIRPCQCPFASDA